MGARTVRRLARLGMAGAMVLVLTGCPEDAADIVEYKATILNFDLAPLGEALLVAGDVSVDGVTLAEFDTTVADAFGRSVPGTRNGYDAGATAFGAGWNITDALRTSANDPRLPALTEDDVVAVPSGDVPPTGVVFADPNTLCGSDCPFHNLWVDGSIENLAPNTIYIVALFRYGLNINGELDAGLVARGEPVDTPDELVAVGGAPSGDPGLEIVSYPTFTAPIAPDANPLVLGYFTSDGSGVGAWDVIVDGTGVLYSDISGDPADASFDSALVARNDDTQTTFPRYNYMVVLEGPAADAADAADNPQAFRFQIGQDVDAATGEPINNGYSPFPLPFSTAELVAAPGGAGRPDSISVEAFNMEPLGGGNIWQAWLVNRDESPYTVAPATATYERVAIVRELDPVTGEIISEVDSILETVAGTSTFPGQFTDVVNAEDQEIKHRLTITDATVGGGSGPGFFTDLVITQESGAATTPSSSTGIWFQYTDQNGTPADYFDDSFGGGTLSFGHFVLDDPASSETFTAVDWAGSRGEGGVRENEVSVEITNLPLPPIGYYYEGWLVGPNGNAVSLGPIKGLPPDTISLFDADINQDLPNVTSTGIRFANVSAVLEPGAIVSQEGDQYIVNLSTFYLTLEPKLGFGGAVKNVADLEVGTLPTATIIDRMKNP